MSKPIAEFEIVDHGIEHEQYFQGCGVSLTEFTDVATGIGNDAEEALDIVDGSVPIYTQEIKDIMYLHGDDVEEAFDNAGIGGKDGKWPMGWQAAAIYCYIDQKVHEWYSENAEMNNGEETGIPSQRRV